MDIVYSFNLAQSVEVPTHLKGYTLDIVLSSGFILDSVNLCENSFCVSDHKATMFRSLLPLPAPSEATYVSSGVLNTNSADRFHNAFTTASINNNNQKSNMSTDELLTNFNNTCKAVLDSVAPVKICKVKSTHCMPWLNDYTREMKKKCRQAEQKWKKDHLLVSFQAMK